MTIELCCKDMTVSIGKDREIMVDSTVEYAKTVEMLSNVDISGLEKVFNLDSIPEPLEMTTTEDIFSNISKDMQKIIDEEASLSKNIAEEVENSSNAELDLKVINSNLGELSQEEIKKMTYEELLQHRERISKELSKKPNL